MRQAARTSRFGLTNDEIDQIMAQLRPILSRISVPAPDTNRDDLLAAYALIGQLGQATEASGEAQRLLYRAETSSRSRWRELNPPPPPPPRRNIVAELLERNRTGRGNTVYDTATIYGPLVGNPITFNRMTSGTPPSFRMLQYRRNRAPSTRDREPTGDFIPSRSASTSSTGASGELSFGKFTRLSSKQR
jgi:hypothetical protein